MNFEPRTKGANQAWLRRDGIIQIVVGDERHAAGMLYDEDDAIAAAELIAGFTEANENALVLTDMRNIRKTSSAARHVAPNPKVVGLALLVSSPVGRMLGNAYLGINKPAHETRLFTDEDRALSWLHGAFDVNA